MSGYFGNLFAAISGKVSVQDPDFELRRQIQELMAEKGKLETDIECLQIDHEQELSRKHSDLEGQLFVLEKRNSELLSYQKRYDDALEIARSMTDAPSDLEGLDELLKLIKDIDARMEEDADERVKLYGKLNARRDEYLDSLKDDDPWLLQERVLQILDIFSVAHARQVEEDERQHGEGARRDYFASFLAKIISSLREISPEGFEEAKALSYVSAEELRINQYDAIVRLYSQKIQNLRSSNMDEEEQQDAIDAMRRLRDREIAELEGAS